MKLKKALISSSFAIAIALTGITVASGTANADTTNNTNTTGDAYVTTQVAPQNVSTSTDAAQTATDASTDTTKDTDTNAVATSATTDTQTQEQAPQANVTDSSATQATTTAATDTTSATKSDENPVVSKIKTTAKKAVGDIVGKDIVGPVSGDVLSKVKPLSNVYAGAVGFADPESNSLGNASHAIQDAAIDVVGAIPGVGGVASTVMKLVQPLDLVDNAIGGVYGLATGKNNLIPDAIGNKVADAINNKDADTKEAKAATVPADTAFYSNRKLNNKVTTTTQAPLFNVMGETATRSLAPNTAWFTDLQRVNTKTGQTFYRVSTNEYVRAQDVVLS
ncbi:hypothetical protein [Companilactobacillus mishanensis]|uniref:Surface layer protein A domain-containing protein n=1 Tax=Companilactobacillus mishanensis TaxID=2486008 RepID=A0A5P0ZIW3_9LACO|nr:hypothetical protein [Companilactobacillus mishanensis]MQS44676.1 hypothetical protein [Companilactobacillus mishanensis]MQS53056.1 hypothetical protein [Companilactobacillus mishanensis]